MMEPSSGRVVRRGSPPSPASSMERWSWLQAPRGGARRRRWPAAAPVLALLLASGCGHAPVAVDSRGAAPRTQPRLQEPLKIVATPGPWGARADAYDAESLFRQANLDLKAERFQAAAEAYDRLLGEFPGTRFTAPALYNAGLSYEGLRRFADAAGRYQLLLAQGPPAEASATAPAVAALTPTRGSDTAALPTIPPLPPGARPSDRDLLDARFRLALCLGEAGAHAAAAALYQALLARPERSPALSPADRVEATARRGHELLALGSLPEAEAILLRVPEVAQAAGESAPGVEDHVAMAQHDLGEVALRYFRALPLRLPQAQLEQDLDAKARMLLSAQGRFIDAVRRRHPRWAPAAGFQLGALYREMYDAVLAAPLPPELDTEEKQQVYRDVLRGKLRPLLERARRVHERNLALASFLGDSGEWARRSNEQLADLDRLLDGPR